MVVREGGGCLVHVRVPLLGEPPVCVAELIRGGGGRHAEDLVGVR